VKKVTPDCMNCAIAGFGPWRVYSTNCAECDIREIANTYSTDRDPLYERIERECGAKALAAVKERVGQEIQRQRLLREKGVPLK
jgi:hypothetical protein